MKHLFTLKVFLIACFSMLIETGGAVAQSQTVTMNFDGDGAFPGDTDWSVTTFTKYTSLSHGGGSNSASTNGKASGNVTYNNILTNVSNVTFYISKTSTNTNTSSYYKVEGSVDNETWTELGRSVTFKEVTKNEWTKTSVDIDNFNGYIRVSYSGTSAIRLLDDITITYSGSGGALPNLEGLTITPADGTAFETTQDVTITCPEGATIYYTTNGDTPTTSSTSSTSDVTFTIDATTTVKVLAQKEGHRDATATATFTKTTVLTGIAGVKTIVTSTTATDFYANWEDVIVTGVNGDNVYLQDATAGILLYLKSHGLAVGDKISGRVSGSAKLYNGVREITALNFTSATKVSGAAVPAPVELTVADILANYDTYEAMLVVVRGVTVSQAFTSLNGTITQGGSELTVRAANNSITMDAQNTVDIKGYLGKYNTTIRLNVLAQEDIVKIAGKEAPTISFANASVTMEIGEIHTITATTDGPAVTYSSSDATVVTVNETTGEVEALKSGSVTITASSAENETYYAATASYTITVLSNTVPEGLSALVAEKNGTYYALQAAKGSANNTLDANEINVVGDKAVITSMDDLPLTAWYIDKENGTIKSYSTSKYVTAESGETNLNLSTTKCKWTWDETNETFVLGDRTILYTTTGYFKNYATSNVNKNSYSDYAHPYSLKLGYVRAVTPEAFGTICLPYAVAGDDLSGVQVYEPIAKRTEGGELISVVLAEVTALEAGKGYFICGTADKLIAAYSGDKVTTPATGNALVGTFDGINPTHAEGANELTGKYMLSGGTLRKCGNGCWLGANRAYLNVDLLTEATSETRGIELGFEGTLTGINNADTQKANVLVDVFTLEGVCVRTAVSITEATKGLANGVYVVGTKKVIVK